MTVDLRSRMTAAIASWRFFVSAILIASACTYVIPIQRSIGLFTATHSNVSTVSSARVLAPVALIATVTAPGQIKLNWAQSASACTTGYNIYCIADPDVTYTLIWFQGGGASTMFVDGGLAPLTVYTYYGEAVCSDWTSPPSPTDTEITP